MTGPGKVTLINTKGARRDGDPMGWAVRGAVFLATFAAALWLSRPVAEEAAGRGAPDPLPSAREAAGASAHGDPIAETFPQDRWDAWLAARQRSQTELAEYTAIAWQISWFLREHVAALGDARRYGSALLSQQISQQTSQQISRQNSRQMSQGTNAAPVPTSVATYAAAANQPPGADAERQRWLALKGRFAQLEAARAQLLATHTPAHPEVAQLDEALAALQNEIRQLERGLDRQDAWAKDGSLPGPSREFAESPPPGGDDLASADLQPTVGNGLSPAIAEGSWPGKEQAEAFCEAMRSLAAGEATLSQLMEQATGAGREVQAALQEEEASAAALHEAWRDAAIRAVIPTPVPPPAGLSTAAVSSRTVSDWGLRGTLAAALSLLATIAAGWIWSGLSEPRGLPGESPPPRRHWRADGPEPLSGPKLLAR